ncbi:MAG TPA: peptidylprolyl isomerase, partial [Bacteroidota bacterium]|nr:peptidylprolyl isomerase [Bacteroidota bacterium]
AGTGSAQPLTGPDARQAILGRAGQMYISEDEFVRRFELLPGLNRHLMGRLNEEKLIVMYSLIAEKLLAQEAEARHIDLDSSTVEGIKELTALLARDALYRKVIVDPVTVSAAELEKGESDALRTLLITYLFIPNEEDARFVRAHIASNSLRATLVDSSMHAMLDTVSVTWGNAEWEVERAAYALKRGEISPVVVAPRGSYILQLTKETVNTFYSRMAPQVRRERVEKAIRLRKEEHALRSYMASFLKEHHGYAVAAGIKRVALALSEAMARTTSDSAVIVDEQALKLAREKLAGSLNDTLLVADGRSWSVDEILDRLFTTGFTARSRDPLVIANTLNAQCRVWSEQGMLEQEAMHDGYAGAPEVQRDLQEWRTSYLAQLMRQRIEDSVRISDADVYRYLERYGKPLPTPMVRIRELRTPSLEEMEKAIGELDARASFADVVARHSSDPSARTRGGLTNFFKITDRPPIGEIAAQLRVGQIYGPFRLADDYLLIQLVGRVDSVSADTALMRRKEETAAELLRLAKKARVEEFIAGSAEKNGFSVFEDRLFAIKVSPIPMLAFRVMGFGGRMFAAPFLPRLFEWINRENPQEKILP